MLLEGLIIFLGLLVDRITKLWALNSLKDSSSVVIIKDIFAFEYLENRGAAFGMLQNRVWLLVLVTFLIVGGMLYYLMKHKPKSKLVRIAMAIIIAGALGNFIDRVYHRYVIDFILWHYKDVYYFPTFNVADILVNIGTALLVICILKDEV